MDLGAKSAARPAALSGLVGETENRPRTKMADRERVRRRRCGRLRKPRRRLQRGTGDREERNLTGGF